MYKHQAPNQIVDTSNWVADAISYEEGAREKSTVFAPPVPQFDFLIPNHRYLSKKSNARAPVQFWMEIVAYRFGCLVDVPVPPAFVSVDSDGECRALSEWFYRDGAVLSRYTPGYNLLKGFDPEMDKRKGLRHSIEAIDQVTNSLSSNLRIIKERFGRNYFYRLVERLLGIEIISTLAGENISSDFLRIFVFDALTGNTDRHHENWGIVFDVMKSSRGSPSPLVRLSPAFDNGTSLGYNFPDEKLGSYLSAPGWFEKYAEKGIHHLRKSPNGEQFGHAELVEFLLGRAPDQLDLVNAIISFEMEELRDILGELTCPQCLYHVLC